MDIHAGERETFGSSANNHNQRVLVVCYRCFRNIYWHNFGMYDLMECANVYVLLCFLHSFMAY